MRCPIKIYLAGYINEHKLEECFAWRKKIREHFDLKPKWHGKIDFLDPMNGEVGKIGNDGMTASLIPAKAFVKRDHKSVQMADLLIVNLDTFGEKRPLTGTIYELAWAWIYRTPVIIITTDPYYVNHPFIQDTACIIVPSVEELLDKEYIAYYYKGLVTASY